MTNRRSFLKTAGLAGIPLVLGAGRSLANNSRFAAPDPGDLKINFVADSDMVSPKTYAEQLQQIVAGKDMEDFYHNGGAVAKLEARMAEITGKEKAIFMPSGTMANQLAIKALSGDRPKVFVQDTSHVYRDEADAAQTVHNKRLIGLAPDLPAFTLAQLKDAQYHHRNGEYMSGAIGAVSIENPVRRGGNLLFPLNDIKDIAAYCREAGWPLHLDGARLHIASAWTGVSIQEYASHFDTVYISLYKYLGAAGGAVLTGPEKIIVPLQRLVKIHGGNMFHAWPYAAMALHNLDTIDERLQQVKTRAEELMALLNKTKKIALKPLPGGTNTYNLAPPLGINVQKFRQLLFDNENIFLGAIADRGYIPCVMNESLLKRPAADITEAMLKAAKDAKEAKK